MDDAYRALARWQAIYAPVELIPAYSGVGFACILTWVVTTPLRNVAWKFFGEVWRVACLHGSLWHRYICQYQGVLENAEIRELRGVAYAYALWGAIFAVPLQVLTDGEERYGDYGRMLHKLWAAAYTTFYAYIPDLSVSTAHSAAKYASVSKDAAISSRRRAGEVLHVAFLICKVLLALAFFVPMCSYDLLEYVSLGVPGVAVVLTTANLLNAYFARTPLGPALTVITVAVGVTTHIWRSCDAKTELEQYSPVTIVLSGLQNLRKRAAERELFDAETLRRLQDDDSATEDLFADPLEDPAVHANMDVRTRPPAAISAELRAAEARSTALRQELARHPDVRRGRRTSSRGVCPVPGYLERVPGVRATDSCRGGPAAGGYRA